METFSALLALYAGNSAVTGEFPAERPVTRSFDIFFDLRLNKRLNKQSWGWWFETSSRSLWCHCNHSTHFTGHRQGNHHRSWSLVICKKKPPVIGGFLSEKANNAESFCISWCLYKLCNYYPEGTTQLPRAHIALWQTIYICFGQSWLNEQTKAANIHKWIMMWLQIYTIFRNLQGIKDECFTLFDVLRK